MLSLFGEMHLSVFRSATLALLPRKHFHSIDIATKSLSELQVWLERRETRFTHKPWPIRPFCSYRKRVIVRAINIHTPVTFAASDDLLLSSAM